MSDQASPSRRRRPVLVVTTPSLDDGWQEAITWPRKSRVANLTNCWSRRSDPTGLLAAILNGGSPWDGSLPDALAHLDRYRSRLAADATAPWESAFDVAGTDLDEPLAVATGWIEALRPAGRERDSEVPRSAEPPWFVVVMAHRTPQAAALTELVAAATAEGAVVVVAAAGSEQRDSVSRVGVWAEAPLRKAGLGDTTPVAARLASLDQVGSWLHREVGLEVLPDAIPRFSDIDWHDPRVTGSLMPDAPVPEVVMSLADPRHRSGSSEPITFVSAVADQALADHNLLASAVATDPRHEWIVVDNVDNVRYDSLAACYSDAAAAASNDLVVFCHHDLYFPPWWVGAFAAARTSLEERDPNWGVIGSTGVLAPSEDGRWRRRARGHHADPRGYRRSGPLPAEVQCLDEIWLAVRRSSGIEFDRDLPGFHCAGIDLSLTAAAGGRRSYAIDAFVWHQLRDRRGGVVTSREDSTKQWRSADAEAFDAQYWPSYEYVSKKWRHREPFNSTSALWGVPGMSYPARQRLIRDGRRPAQG